MSSTILRATLLAFAVLAAACSAQALEFTIGECVNLPDEDQISDYEVVDCDEPHDAEVFALPQSPEGEDAEYPGQEPLESTANERCRDAFEGYVGEPYDSSEIYSTALTPSQESWEQANDREIVCLLVGGPVGDGTYEQLTGSQKEGS